MILAIYNVSCSLTSFTPQLKDCYEKRITAWAEKGPGRKINTADELPGVFNQSHG